MSIYALPAAVAIATIVGVGAMTILREGHSRATLPFIAIMIAMLLWMTGGLMMYLSANAETADFWIRFGSIGLVYTPTAALFFTIMLIDRAKQTFPWLVGSVVLSTVFLLTAWLSPLHISGIDHYVWGYYPRYGVIGALFMLYVGVVLGACLRMLWVCRKEEPRGSIGSRRITLLMLGIAVASLSSVDFLATIGINFYPVGFAPVLFLFCILAFVTWNYRLFDITPALASQRIIDTMTDALVVTDDQGIIRLLNPAACILLGA
ncbi:MAG: PAS domain-containing protein, partial [Gammaproteobacteria bacterium]|nr:PAS domain-containing protein [Gammaproteobacteria bacterium]